MEQSYPQAHYRPFVLRYCSRHFVAVAGLSDVLASRGGATASQAVNTDSPRARYSTSPRKGKRISCRGSVRDEKEKSSTWERNATLEPLVHVQSQCRFYLSLPNTVAKPSVIYPIVISRATTLLSQENGNTFSAIFCL